MEVTGDSSPARTQVGGAGGGEWILVLICKEEIQRRRNAWRKEGTDRDVCVCVLQTELVRPAVDALQLRCMMGILIGKEF